MHTIIRTKVRTEGLDLTHPFTGRQKLEGIYVLRREPSSSTYSLVQVYDMDNETLIADDIRVPQRLQGMNAIPVVNLVALRFEDLHQAGLTAVEIQVDLGLYT